MIAARDELMANPEQAEEILTEHVENRKRSILTFKTDARAEAPLLSQHISDDDAVPNAPDNIHASIDLLMGEIESRIENVAQLCDDGSKDVEYRQRLVDRLTRFAKMRFLPEKETLQ
jgi:hypothetical protein